MLKNTSMANTLIVYDRTVLLEPAKYVLQEVWYKLCIEAFGIGCLANERLYLSSYGEDRCFWELWASISNTRTSGPEENVKFSRLKAAHSRFHLTAFKLVQSWIKGLPPFINLVSDLLKWLTRSLSCAHWLEVFESTAIDRPANRVLVTWTYCNHPSVQLSWHSLLKSL